MVHHLFDDLVRHGGDVGTGKGALGDVHWMANAGGDDLRVNVAGGFEDRHDLSDEIGAAGGDVVETAEERRNIGGAGARSQKRLVGRKYEGHIGLDAESGERFYGFQPFDGHRDLHDHIWMDGCDGLAFFDHPCSVGGRRFNFAADRSIDDLGDLSDDFFKHAAFLGNQRRIRRHAADHAHVVGFLDVFDLGGIDKKFHGSCSFSFHFPSLLHNRRRIANYFCVKNW